MPARNRSAAAKKAWVTRRSGPGGAKRALERARSRALKPRKLSGSLGTTSSGWSPSLQDAYNPSPSKRQAQANRPRAASPKDMSRVVKKKYPRVSPGFARPKR